MKTALLHEQDGLRTFVLVLATDEEALGAMTSFAAGHQIHAAHFTAIGAFSRVIVAYFDWSTKAYHHIEIREQVEVLSLVGDVSLEGNVPKIHTHCVVGKRDATAHGGHVIEAHVRPTLEVILTELPRHLHRRFDAASGLNLIDPRGSAGPG